MSYSETEKRFELLSKRPAAREWIYLEEVPEEFTKFLISRDGVIAARFDPTEDMKVVAHKVKEIL